MLNLHLSYAYFTLILGLFWNYCMHILQLLYDSFKLLHVYLALIICLFYISFMFIIDLLYGFLHIIKGVFLPQHYYRDL